MASLPTIPSTVTNKTQKLKKMTLVELKESLERQNRILMNKKIIGKLPDKGKSIEDFRDQISAEIEFRAKLEEAKNISILNTDDQQHVQHICEIEKRTSVTERYKPSSTLYHSKEINPHSTAIRLIEDCGTSQNPSKLIPLGESLCIQKQQEERVQEEQIRRRQKSLFEKLLQYLPDDADSSEENSLESSIASSMENLVVGNHGEAMPSK